MAKKNGLWNEFKAFAIKGNAMNLAVGVIIGSAFSTITTSLTNDMIMPIVSMFLGGINFSDWYITLPQWFGTKTDADGNVLVNTLNYGNFLSTVINFFILAFVVFMLVKGLNKLTELGEKAAHKEKEEAAPPAPPAPSKEEVLLTEIRDLLKKKSNFRGNGRQAPGESLVGARHASPAW